MTMLRRLKEAQASRVEEQDRRAHEQLTMELATHATRAYAAWEAAKLEDGETHVQGIAMKKGEIAHLIMSGVGLVEPRRDPGRWVGASHGMSFKVAKGVRYRVGQTRGTFQQGEERPQIIDTGLGVITNQRMVFVGSNQTTEWSLAKLVGFSLDQDGMAIFNVSNRQKASGFAYQPDVDHIVDAVVAAAIARYQSPQDHAAVVEELAVIYREVYAAWAEAAGEAGEKPIPDSGDTPSVEASPVWGPPQG